MKNKSIFNGRSKGLMALCLTVVLAVTLLSVGAIAATNNTAQYIGETKAKSIALTHAGVTEAQATFLRVHLDRDDGYIVYDVEFYSGNTEYDYEIDAATGDIVEYDRDIERYNIPSGTGTAPSGSAAQYIGETKAKSIALTHAGVTEAQATFLRTRLDRDDGYIVYDVEFYSGNTEYDYEIDAITGDIVEYDRDIERYHIPSGTGTAAQYIGEDKAKTAVLTHAGVAADQATFTRVRLDRDDGHVVYDVNFYSGNTRYDYEVDALTGDIVEYGKKTGYNAGTSGSTGSSASPGTAAQYIGEDKAKSIALTAEGLTESQTRRMKVKLDREHGTMVYEIEFKVGQMEYEYEIDAFSGSILESDAEYDD